MALSMKILALAAFMVGLGRPSLVASMAIESNELPEFPTKCPMVMAKAEETCVDAKSTCWSAGQKDVDCLEEELCCFDGCAHHCKKPEPTIPDVPEVELPEKCETVYEKRTENKTEEKCDIVHEKECRTEFVREECHDDCKTEYDTVEKKETEDRCKVIHEHVCKNVTDQVEKCPTAVHADRETCVDTKSTCWSPGQKDVDCLDEELCCFDGCAHHCKKPELSNPPSQEQVCFNETKEVKTAVEKIVCRNETERECQEKVVNKCKEVYSDIHCEEVPEQAEYSNGTEAVRCAEAGTNHCEKVNNQVCHTEVQRANITAAEIEQKCEEEPKQICRNETVSATAPLKENVTKCFDEPQQLCSNVTEAVRVPYIEAVQDCVKVPYEDCNTTKVPHMKEVPSRECWMPNERKCKNKWVKKCSGYNSWSNSWSKPRCRKVKEHCIDIPVQRCKVIIKWETTYTEEVKCEMRHKDECATVQVEKTKLEAQTREVCETRVIENCQTVEVEKTPLEEQSQVVCETQSKEDCIAEETEKTQEKEIQKEVCEDFEEEICKVLDARVCQKCERRKEEVCEDVTVEECKELPKEVCEPKVEYVTTYETVPVCKIKEVPPPPPKEVCQEVAKTVCYPHVVVTEEQVPRQVCTQQCKDVVEEVCEDKPVEKCETVTTPVEYEVPVEKCEEAQ